MPKPEIDYTSYGVPADAVILNELHIVEYLDADDGEIYKQDLSAGGDGEPLGTDKAFALIEWARLIVTSEMLPGLIHDYVGYDEDEDEE